MNTEARSPGVIAGLFVLVTPFIAGSTTAGLTAYADCRKHVGDSCIPFEELVFGATIFAITFAWIAIRLHREQDWVRTFAAVYVSLGLWMLMMLPVMWLACPRTALDETCSRGLWWGMVLVPVAVAIATWVLRLAQRRATSN